MSPVKKICICSFCVALCAVLPPAFHSLGLGAAFSPMHLPVLLCGLVCGWPYGLFCGAAGALLSSAVTGMPPAAILVYMVPELCAYGLAAGALMRLVRTGNVYADLYLSLVPAMLIGRVVGGLARALFCLSTAQSWSVALWAGAYLVETLPGAVLQIILIPALVLALTRARLLPGRYSGSEAAL